MKRADLGSASLVCSILDTIVRVDGYLVCLTGSTLFQGQGDDIDIVLIRQPGPLEDGSKPPSPEYIAQSLKRFGMTTELITEEVLLGSEVGIKCEYHGLVLDIAIIDRHKED